jgi:hypothetical protein
MTIDIYAELYLWNKNVDPLIRVPQRLHALRILHGQSLNEYEIRLEELRLILNLTILENNADARANGLLATQPSARCPRQRKSQRRCAMSVSTFSGEQLQSYHR